jgi:monovalent cation:H+ antiporter-2, CPA2 family
MEGSPIYRDLAYVFATALCGGLLAKWLRQPLILGYVLGGILIGPFTPGPTISELHFLELLAEIGVILLMYSIGIEFSPKDLLQVKWVALLGGPLGILLSILMGLVVGHFLDWSPLQGVAVGAIISVASTMVLSRFLIDRGEMKSPHGNVMIGITLVEDLAVVILTVVLPALADPERAGLSKIGWALLKAALVLVPAGFIATRVIPPFMASLARGPEELFLLVTLALGFATAALTQALGLSLAMGAFMAGLLISEAEYAHKMLGHLLPLRDAFVALFFVTVGALVNPRALINEWLLVLMLVGMVVAGKFAIWLLVVRIFRYPWLVALRVAVGLTQIGEFSYVLVQICRDSRIVDAHVYNATLAASLITIVLNALLTRLAFPVHKARPAPALRSA